MHGPDGKDYPNESRFTRIASSELIEIEHLSGHHFILSIELMPFEQGTQVHWRQTFDTVEHYDQIAQFVAGANEQNLQRLAAEVLGSRNAAYPFHRRDAKKAAPFGLHIRKTLPCSRRQQ